MNAEAAETTAGQARQIRTVGLVFSNLSLGGIQRVLSALIPILVGGGRKVVLMTSAPAGDGDYAVDADYTRICIGRANDPDVDRTGSIRRTIREHNIDLVIHHEYYLNGLEADVEAIHAEGVPVLVHMHNVFSAMLFKDKQQLDLLKFARLYQRLDGMLCLSHVDERYLKSLGIRTFYMPNPIERIPRRDAARARGRVLLWFARFTDVKQPIHALRIFERVLAAHPDAELYMLGETETHWGRKSLDYLAARPALAKAVRLEGFRSDVASYLAKADVALVTSKIEGFCLSLMEAKAAGVPVVCYEMPYLETTHPGTGLISVPQGDVAAAAKAVMRILADQALADRLGDEGRADYERFAAVDLPAAYEAVFREVSREPFRRAVDAPPDTERIMVETMLAHTDYALRLFAKKIDNLNKKLADATSAKP